ncbi:MAG: TetR/AcrR family transcriptional regulator [Candidatus Dormibacteraeota bacterium]|nr:TetR/AcrR family transcriptional regulator [Candidatus Dormibacteraeota bacterium]
MKRGKYHLKARAESETRTRKRIVEAAVALHSEVGPALTTVRAIAARAGVGRPTVYRHFPDDLSLFTACSSYGATIHPLPDPEQWLLVVDPALRTRTALQELYSYYRQHERRLTNILRDAESIPAIRQVNEIVISPRLRRMQEVLEVGWVVVDPTTLSAALGTVLHFYTWRLMTRDQRLDDAGAIALAVAIVSCGARDTR